MPKLTVLSLTIPVGEITCKSIVNWPVVKVKIILHDNFHALVPLWYISRNLKNLQT
jgi:hypothetical protein